jgi:von Willebrand factor type A domain
MRYLSVGPGGLLSILSLCLLLVACEGETGGLTRDTGGGPGGDGPAAKLDLGFTPKTCNPACVSPQFCSVHGVCLDPGECKHDKDCPAGKICDPATGKCVLPGQCGAKEIAIDAVPPNLLISLDRSCSMTSKVGTKSKWEISVDAIAKMLSNYKDKIRFGLALFPDTVKPSCKQDKIAIPVGPGNETKVQFLLISALQKSDANYPNGPCVTNIDTAMQQAATDPALKDTTRANYVLLITDGKQYGCSDAGGDKGTTQIITDLYKKSGVATFVIGFGKGVDPKQLNIFADAGGVPSSDPTTRFYKAEDQKTLDTALAAIASKAFNCVFKLGQVPPNLDKIYVFFDNKEVARDTGHKDGWDYDPVTNQITFYGSRCGDLKAGKVKDVDIVYGCKKPTDGGPALKLDGGGGSCQPGQIPCKDQNDCPANTKCTSGCCVKVIQ